MSSNKIIIREQKHKQLIEKGVLDKNKNNIIHNKKTLLEFPKDIIDTIINIMPIESILNLCKSNKKFNKLICNNNNFWRKRLKSDYKVTLPFSLSLEKRMYMELNKNTRIPNYVYGYLYTYIVGFKLVTKEGQNRIFEDFTKYFKDNIDIDIDIDRHTKEIKTLEYKSHYFKYDDKNWKINVTGDLIDEIMVPLLRYMDPQFYIYKNMNITGDYDYILLYLAYKDMITFLG